MNRLAARRRESGFPLVIRRAKRTLGQGRPSACTESREKRHFTAGAVAGAIQVGTGGETRSIRPGSRQCLYSAPRYRGFGGATGGAILQMVGGFGGSSMAGASMDATILFADICNSVRLFDTLGDEQAHRYAVDSLQIMATMVTQFDGQVWRTLGDGVLSTFPDPDRAFLAAIGMQQKHRAGPIAIKVGFSHGHLIEDGGELFGDAANLAARITALARPGEILLGEEAVRALSDRHSGAVEMLISTLVKGKKKPVKIYRAIEKSDLQATQQISLELSQSSKMKVRTLVVSGADGVETRLTPESEAIIIGRAPGCELFADSPLASRRHATIDPRGEK